MKDCTYYDLLGVSSNATDEEINAAKNFLVKKFHPDSNVDTDFDTTTYMQNVLFAYRVLSNPDKRKGYDRHIKRIQAENQKRRSHPRRTSEPSPDFTPYWEASNKLNELVIKSTVILNETNEEKGFHIPFRKKSHNPEQAQRLQNIAADAKVQVDLLQSGKIPQKYWYSHAMNWLLFQWTQRRDYSYDMLFALYDGYMAQKKSSPEKKKITTASAEFQKNLEILMSFMNETTSL